MFPVPKRYIARSYFFCTRETRNIRHDGTFINSRRAHTHFRLLCIFSLLFLFYFYFILYPYFFVIFHFRSFHYFSLCSSIHIQLYIIIFHIFFTCLLFLPFSHLIFISLLCLFFFIVAFLFMLLSPLEGIQSV